MRHHSAGYHSSSTDCTVVLVYYCRAILVLYLDLRFSRFGNPVAFLVRCPLLVLRQLVHGLRTAGDKLGWAYVRHFVVREVRGKTSKPRDTPHRHQIGESDPPGWTEGERHVATCVVVCCAEFCPWSAQRLRF